MRLAALLLSLLAGPAAGGVEVAITVDDLPWSGVAPPGETERSGLERIAAVLRVHGAPATGFAICDSAGDGSALAMWTGWRLPLGNHTAAHRDLHRTPLAEWLAGVARCHAALQTHGAAYRPLLRYPLLHQGADRLTRDAAREGLERLGLSLAPVTVDTSDWILARAYGRALEAGDATARAAVGRDLVRHVAGAIEHAEAVAWRKLGRSLPHVLLLHANALLADHLDPLLLELRRRGIRFVDLEQALRDPAYATPDDYAGPRGLSFLYRMAPATPQDAAWDDAEAKAIEERFAGLLQATTPAGSGSRIAEQPVRPADPRLLAAIELAALSERTRSLLVMHRGRLLVEAHFNGGDGGPTNLKSATKSLTSALVGVALRRGELGGLDEPISRHLPELFEKGRNADAAGITLRHLLTMTSGLGALDYDAFQQSGAPLRELLEAPRRSAPGRTFAYDTPLPSLLTAALERATGVPVREYANRELLGPLGGEVPYWRADAQGLAMGGNDAYLRPLDLLRLGELYRSGGVHQGRRLLDEGFVRTSVAPLVTTGEPTINHGTLPVRGYGLSWWALALEDEDAFAALGHGGQELLVFPRRELVVLLTSRWPGPSSTEHYRHLLRVLREGILPSFPRQAGRATAASSG